MLRQLLSSGGETLRLRRSPRVASRRLITGTASSSHTVEYTSFGEAVRNFHVKQKAATSLSTSINSSQRKLSACGLCIAAARG